MTVSTSDVPGHDRYGRAGDAIRFLQAFDPDGWHSLVAFDPFSGKPIDACTFAPEAWRKMADWISGHVEQCNLYFSVGEPKPNAPHGKLKKSDIATVRALFADLDPQGGAEEFESERVRIRLRIDELLRDPLPPSFVIDSGGGMQLFWKLDQPIEVDAASQNRVENIGRAIAFALKADAVQNIDRIMRLPGTTNFPNAMKQRKGRKTRSATLIADNGLVHAIDDIAREFPVRTGERARSRAEAAEWAKYADLIDHEAIRHLDGYDELPGDLIVRFEQALAGDNRLRAMWELGEKEGGRTGSDYVYALGMALLWHGFSIEDFARLAWIWRFAAGSSGRDVNAGSRALSRVWAKATSRRMSVGEQARRLLKENARQRIEHARAYRCSHGQ